MNTNLPYIVGIVTTIAVVGITELLGIGSYGILLIPVITYLMIRADRTE